MTRIAASAVPGMGRFSDGEEALASQIRLQMADYPPQREYPFDPEAKGRKWRFDFAWPEWRIAVEVEGGTWVGGHVKSGRFAQDAEKYNAAALAGWMVLRFPTEWVVDGSRQMDRAIGYVKEALTLRVIRYCSFCHRQWRPLASPRETERHAPMSNGLRPCEGHSARCSAPCGSDHK